MFIWEFVAATVMDNLLDWFFSQLIGFLGNFFAVMGNMGVELFELPWVQAIVGFFSNLAWSLFGVSLVVACFECGIEYSSGRANIRQTAMNILKGFFAVSLFTVAPVRLYALSITMQASLTQALAGYGNSLGELGQEGLPLPGKSSCFFCPAMKRREIRTLYHRHRDLYDRAIAIEDNARPNLLTVKGLGRDWSWRDFVEADRNQVALCGLFSEIDMPCGCFDGGE